MENQLRFPRSMVNGICRACDWCNQRHSLFIILFGLGYKVFLDLNYAVALVPYLPNAGFTLEPSFIRYAFSWILYLVLFFYFPKKENDFVSFFLNIQLIIMVAPMLTYYGLSGRGSTVYILLVFLCMLLEGFLLKRKKKKTAVMVSFDGIQPHLLIIFGAVVLFFCVVWLLYNGFYGLDALNFTNVYDIRSATEYPPFFVYLKNWVQRAIVPFFIAYFLMNKQYWLAFFSCGVQFFIFLLTAEKFTLFILIAIIGVFFIAKQKVLLKGMYAAFCVLTLGSLLMLLIAPDSIPVNVESYAVRRFLFLPAQLKFQYFDIFSVYPPVMFADGTLGSLFSLSSVYSISVPNIIESCLQGISDTSNCNTGYLGDSYAQLGAVGMFVISILLAAVIRFVDRIAEKGQTPMLVALFVVPLIALNDGAFFTAFLTGGMWLIVLLIVLFNQPARKLGKAGCVY